MILGVDPGLKGGLSFYDGTESAIYATPVISTKFIKNGKSKTRNEMNLGMVCEIIRKHNPTRAIIEKVGAMPGQGVTGMFRLGQNVGQWEGIFTALGIPFEKVTPQTWKALYKLNADKSNSLELATSLFPAHAKLFKLKKNDGLAESILIARYGHVVRDIG